MTQLEDTREDGTEFVRFLVYPLLLIVYIGCLSLCIKKIVWNLEESKPIIKGLFAVNCCTFMCRVVFFMDFSLHYPDELFFFLDYWPFFTTVTAAYLLVTSWLSLVITINHPESASHKIGRLNQGIFVMSIAIQLTYFSLYFAMFHGDFEQLPLAIRLLISMLEFVAILSLGVVGNKLITLVSDFWERELTYKLRLMQVFGMLCFTCRMTINLVSTAISKESGFFVTYQGGYLWGCFLLFDYTFSEIAFTFAVTSVIASQARHNSEISSSSDTSLLMTTRLRRLPTK